MNKKLKKFVDINFKPSTINRKRQIWCGIKMLKALEKNGQLQNALNNCEVVVDTEGLAFIEGLGYLDN